MSQIISDRPRPSFTRALAEHLHTDVLLWVAKAKDRINEEWYTNLTNSLPRETEALITLLDLCFSFRDGDPDSFLIGADLKNHCNWPVDGELVELINNGIRYTREQGYKRSIMNWMMATGTRVSGGIGDKVKVSLSGGEVKDGVIKRVHRLTAEADISFDSDPETVLPIPAEFILNTSASQQESLVA